MSRRHALTIGSLIMTVAFTLLVQDGYFEFIPGFFLFIAWGAGATLAVWGMWPEMRGFLSPEVVSTSIRDSKGIYLTRLSFTRRTQLVRVTVSTAFILAVLFGCWQYFEFLKRQPAWYPRLNNSQLKSEAIDVSHEIQDFVRDSKNEEVDLEAKEERDMIAAKTAPERNLVWSEYGRKLQVLLNNRRNVFNRNFQAKIMRLQDVISARLSKEEREEYERGRLAGPVYYRDPGYSDTIMEWVAGDLERLAIVDPEIWTRQ